MWIYFQWTTQNSLSIWRSAWILQKTQLSMKIVFQERMSQRKKAEKEKQQLGSLWYTDDKWQWHVKIWFLLIENKWYCYCMNNETIDYTLIWNEKQEIVLNKNCHHWSVRNKEVQFVWIFSLGPRFRIRCPHHRVSVLERLILQGMYGHFPGTKWTVHIRTGVRIREVSIL